MIRLTMMNSNGNSKVVDVRATSTVAEITNTEEARTLFANTMFALNGVNLTPSDYGKSLEELGCAVGGTATLVGVKMANSAC